MKDFFKAIAIVGLFAFLGIATSKEVYEPCEGEIRHIIDHDLAVKGYLMQFSNDTVVIWTNKDSLWDIKSDQVCRILRDSCQFNGRKVLVVRTAADPTQADTQFGNKVYFRTCP